MHRFAMNCIPSGRQALPGTTGTSPNGRCAYAGSLLEQLDVDSGEAKVKVKDTSAAAGPSTEDDNDAEIEFTSSDGQISYRLVVKQAMHRWTRRTSEASTSMHSNPERREFGSLLMPQLISYIAFWGGRDLEVNGVQLPENRFVHFMLSNNVRHDDNLTFNNMRAAG